MTISVILKRRNKMFNKKYALVLFLITLMSIFTAACSPTPAQNVESEKWVIFSAEQASEQRIGEWLVAGDKAVDYWTPSEKDVILLENSLPAFLQKNSDRFYTPDAPVWERLDEYNRQYIGMILNDSKVIYANYFCNNFNTDWRKDFVFVLDGGACYFQFNYDADTGIFFDLMVNGEA